jgi:hypothetical protein
MKRNRRPVLAAALALALAGCTSVVFQGPPPAPSAPASHGANTAGASALSQPMRVFLPPFFNATDDDHASRALTELTASALLESGVPLVQTEPALTKSRLENAAGADGLYLDTARALGATHLLLGTVHEYRYKTDLDGDPAVGLTLRLVDAKDGRTLWQGSSAKVSVFFSSLSKTAQRAVRDLVKRSPLASHPPHSTKR